VPQFTIAVPTYNRAHLVAETIACALQQTHPDFELLVCDNASADDTEKVVRGFGDSRIVYHRQPALVPVCENFATCGDRATGDWLVINQDDDFLCPFFLERCAKAIRGNPGVVMYCAETLFTTNPHHHFGGTCHSLPLMHRWDRPLPRTIPGAQIASFLWFTSMLSFPPLAVPTPLFRKHWERDPARAMELESLFSARVACEGLVAFDSYIGAVFRQHEQQQGRAFTADMHRAGRERVCACLADLFRERGIDWRPALAALAPEMPRGFRTSLAYILILEDVIPTEAFEILLADVAQDENTSPADYVRAMKARRLESERLALEGERGSRLERLGVPRAAIRFLRGMLYALGKDYNGIVLK
jgi:hypothetical protein